MKYHKEISVLAVGLILIAGPLAAGDARASHICYIQEKKVADLEVPPLRGEYYNDLIPDTLDIAERAQLAINALTGNTDPAYDYEIYWNYSLERNPPIMWHDWNDWCGPKFWETLPLLRAITGSKLNNHIDPVWLNVMLRSIGPDGLFYIPMGERPWAWDGVQWGAKVWRAGATTDVGDTSVKQIAHPMDVGRVMSLMAIYYQIDKNPAWIKLIEKMIDRSLEITVDKGDYAYIPLGFYEPNAKITGEPNLPTGLPALESYARLIQAPIYYYKLTGYEPAKEISKRFINCVRYHGRNFDSEGRFIAAEGLELERGAHFHAHTIALLGMVEYAQATGDQDVMNFAKKSFEWARSQGNATVGFFPEWLRPDYLYSETCEVAEMITLAIKLSQAGAGDYWDDAEKWIRNQFAENQLTKIDWIYSLANQREREDKFIDNDKIVPTEYYTERCVPERNLGAFAGWPSANSWGGEVMPCCTGNGARTIYYIWENILDYENGELKVNLLLNRASLWADFYSYIPYEGQVRLKIKSPCKKVLVRMPEWVVSGSQEVKCLVNGKARQFDWEGKYIDVGACEPGKLIKVIFPIETRKVKETIAGKDYTLVIRGNTVCSIDPPGKYCPFYEREYYLKNNMAWRPVRRFVPECVIDY